MRSFNEREHQIISSLLESPGEGVLCMQNFLCKNYFTKKPGRALILQNQGQYAVLFLKPDLFDNEETKAREVQRLFELLALLHFLVKEGYLTIYNGSPEKMYYLQDDFDAVKIVNNSTIVLNTKGYYTSEPNTIHDSDKNVAYKGIEFRGQEFHFILNYCVGILLISPALGSLMGMFQKNGAELPYNEVSGVNNTTTDTNQRKKTALPDSNTLLLVFILFLLCISSIYVYLINERHSEKMQSIDSLFHAANAKMEFLFTSPSQTMGTPRHTTMGQNADSTYYYGLDISKWNGNEVSEIPMRDSISFIICKATEGGSYTDPDFSKNWDIIRKHNYILGSYHFYHVADDPLKQAIHFLTTLDIKGKTDISPIVDIEYASIPEGNQKSVEQIQNEVLTFLNHVELKYNRIPMIYTSTAFGNRFLNNKQFSRYPLWIAEYTTAKAPELPTTWQETGYKIWQKRDNYFVDSKLTDLDIFFGVKKDLLK